MNKYCDSTQMRSPEQWISYNRQQSGGCQGLVGRQELEVTLKGTHTLRETQILRDTH